MPNLQMSNLHTVPAAYPEQKSVRNVRAHREMAIHIERTGFLDLGRIVMDESGSKVSRFKRNMPAYESLESVLSAFETEIWHADFTTKNNDYAHHHLIQYRAYVWMVPIPEHLDSRERSRLKIHVLVHLDFLTEYWHVRN